MTVAHHPHSFSTMAPMDIGQQFHEEKTMAPAQELPALFQGMAVNSAEASGHTRGLGRVWLFIPALWLLVCIAGCFALSYWPELFAEPRRTDRSPDCAECKAGTADEFRAESP